MRYIPVVIPPDRAALNATLAAALLLAAFAPSASARPVAAHRAAATGRPAPEARRTPEHLRFAPGEVVVIADPASLDAAQGGRLLAGDGDLARVLSDFGLGRARRADPAPSRRSAGRERIWVLSSDRPGFDPVAAAGALMATGRVRAASPNYRFGLFYTAPNDLYLVFQWYVDDGSSADIRLPYAWDTARGDSSVSIAIIDTGVDTGHPDLASKIWHNTGEIPGNSLDDDGNGLVDDWEGWDFGTGDNDPNPEYTADASGIDVGFHGTFCAGIAAAATHNDEGIAGAGWNCRIMPLKVAHPDSGITSEALAGAFTYAVDQGASVISLSLGGPVEPGEPEFFQALVDMAVFSGSVCVAAAGNDGDSVRTYPAACDDVLAVGATDYDNLRATFSNFGSWVDVAAPGSFMFSSICRNYTFTELDQLFYILLFGWDGLTPYMYGDGTSFACPLVAGVCGLVRARFPALTPQLVMQQIVSTGDAVAYDQPIGPRVNALRAVTQTPTAVALGTRAPSLSLAGAAPNPLSGAGTIRFALPQGGMAKLVLFDAAGRRVRGLVDGTLAPGTHAAAWDGRDDRGRDVASGVYFAKLEAGSAVLRAKVVLVRP